MILNLVFRSFLRLNSKVLDKRNFSDYYSFMFKNRVSRFVVMGAILAVPFVAPLSASAQQAFEQTAVNGQVKDQSNNVVVGANIQISCNSTTVNTTTDSIGKYYYYFDTTTCPLGASVSVTATKNDQAGSGSATVQTFINTPQAVINIALVNITTNTVPEFTSILALGTAMTSAGGYLLMRRRKYS